MTWAAPMGGQVGMTVFDRPFVCHDPEAAWIADVAAVTHPPTGGSWRHSLACGVFTRDDSRCTCKDDEFDEAQGDA